MTPSHILWAICLVSLGAALGRVIVRRVRFARARRLTVAARNGSSSGS